MKNTIQITIFLLALLISSCAGMKKTDSHSKENQMKIDALAKAQVECEYKLVRRQHLDNKSDARLINEHNKLKEDMTTMRQTFFKRYQDPEEDLVKFEAMVKKSMGELSVCKKLVEQKEAAEKLEKKEKKEEEKK